MILRTRDAGLKIDLATNRGAVGTATGTGPSRRGEWLRSGAGILSFRWLGGRLAAGRGEILERGSRRFRGLAWGVVLLATACGAPSPDSSPALSNSNELSPVEPAAEVMDFKRVPPPEDLPRDRALQVGFLVVDGVYNTELTAPYDIFQHTIFHAPPGMEVFTVSPDGGRITTFEGLVLEPHHSFATAPEIDILVVPSAEHSMDSDLENEEMMQWVQEVGGKARFLLSLCDGAFVLAAAGLLDGLAVTTFPGDQDRFAEMFPHLDLRRGVSFVHDGKAITSWGGARSFDPAMYLADHLYGEKATQGIGRGMVIPWPPAPGTMPAVVIEP